MVARPDQTVAAPTPINPAPSSSSIKTTMGQIATASSLAPPIRRGRASGWADRNFKWLMVAPAVLIILAFSIYPLLFSLWVAFVNYDFQIPGPAFVGLQNFQQIIDDPLAWSSLGLTIVLSVTVVAIEFVLGLALALAMVKTFRGRGIVMSILIIPLFVILLAGLAAIPPHLYEAAELDGIGAIQTFRYVTLPQLASVMLLGLTLRLLDAVKLFDVIFMLTGGGPGTSTYTTSFYLYQIGFQQFHLSIATAGSWLFLILLAVVIMAVVRR